MLDRLDDGLEPFARAFTGKTEWDEMKENALAATASPPAGPALPCSICRRLSPGFHR